MNKQKRKRSRGLVFSHRGWAKLVAKKQIWEDNHKSGKKCTLEDLSEITGLSYNTVLKIQERRQGVDKRSLVNFSLAFGLELNSSDCVSPNSLSKSDFEHHTEKVNWDEPIELPSFYGRSTELALLEQWLVEDRCRLVIVRGVGGIGKTALCVKLIDRVQHKFDSVIWRSLKKESSFKELLIELLGVLIGKPQAANASNLSIRNCKQRLLECLRSQKCLIVLDCLDKTMVGGELCGSYSSEHQDYAHFIKYIGQTIHNSCLLLITREKPKEISFIEGKSEPLRSLNLTRLSSQAAREMLSASDLLGTQTEQKQLIDRFHGHPLTLQLVAKEIHHTCDRQIALFLAQELKVQKLQDFWNQYLERLSCMERKILSIIADWQKPLSFSTLRRELPASISSKEVIDSLESLFGRSLIIKKSSAFSICPQLSTFIYLLKDDKTAKKY